MERVTPPYRIRTARTVLRCWDPRDAPLLKEAVDSSIDHLRPWMPWAADEPQPLDAKVELLRRFRGNFDLGEDFVYGIFSPDESEALGGSGLHTRVGPSALEIGYWVRASRAGEGIATEISAALTRAAFDVCGVDRVEIHVEPENVRSAAIPRKLGFREEAVLRRRLPPNDGTELRDCVVYSLFADDYPSTPSASAEIEALDALGNRLL